MDPAAPGSPALHPKLTWLILCAAFTVAPVMYFVVGSQIGRAHV